MSTGSRKPRASGTLAPAMHPGDRDTHLDLDDLIDHSHEATQQASAGAQHPTRRWKRGVGRKSKTRKPRNPDAVMPLAIILSNFANALFGHCRHHHHVDSGMDVQRSGVSYPATTVPDGGRAATGTDEHHIQWRGLRIQRKAGDCVLPWSDGLLPVVVIPSVGIH